MKTASVKEPSVISVSETENPSLESGDILVQMHACGICGSDLEKVFGQYGQPSMRLGHEPAGVVLDVGSDVAEFKKGDRVFTHHHVPCYDCHFCNHGNETMCKKYYETNLSPCGLSEQYVVPAWNVSHGGVLKISDSLSFEEAAMIEPLACCVRAWTKFSYQEGDSAAIFGVGPTGMMHVMLAQAKKFSKIFCFDVNDFRLDFAKKFNITESINSTDETRKQKILGHTENRGVDVAIVATSSLKALDDAIDMVRKGGAVMMFGVPSKGAKMDLDMSKIYSKEITLVTSYAASDNDTKEALNLIESSQIDVKQLITHTYTIDDTQKAFDHARSGENAMKIIITK
ncbi:L-threonine 3-dehydrogenase protein [Marine Group I thaumarchaeote SCGC AAA799-E16]|uniref:L-threonine 3-dehydrogenase protein n=4 Tax=Marine Group I TaxID=905826 RepID=A0A081RPC0_9ARCH|nr:L-threonine 3-dehydrogenase protein [Marine Group I thaumarchaeote SCGC AAA799-N04]KER06587.1 L-threonine 3-dehydrogenase protein [Marine Group I thaumarchaeote SCGC AAA799-E16]KFM16099.1 L-threonine 3-dehydrogenase protein [Marine Group I thaumarchaeote SCGC AAA799-D11]KFM17836.1 L-threonine 3-dehydrogenase protein [Marine Group I thaumarchaeote SCGC RSA3]